MPELVSILIPAYNAEPWIEQTLRSALNQTWPRTEIIVVDDGSKDATLKVARSLENRSLKVVSQPNAGAPAARNRALKEAQGAFIQWLDADDLLDPDKITLQMKVAAEVGNRFLLSCPFGTFYYRPEKARFTKTSLWCDLTPTEYMLTRFRDNVCFQTDAWLVSRELSETAGPWTDHGSPDDDGEYFCRIAAKSGGVKFVEGARSYYRVGDVGSLSRRSSELALTALLGSKVKCIRYLLTLEDSARTRRACIQLLQDWLPHFYPEWPALVDQARELARELGGELSTPKVMWKYRPVEWLFGYQTANRLIRAARAIRMRSERTLDKYLFDTSAVLGNGRPLPSGLGN
jgi:glycosyltransferase involved in cell wall biosynthesis